LLISGMAMVGIAARRRRATVVAKTDPRPTIEAGARTTTSFVCLTRR